MRGWGRRSRNLTSGAAKGAPPHGPPPPPSRGPKESSPPAPTAPTHCSHTAHSLLTLGIYGHCPQDQMPLGSATPLTSSLCPPPPHGLPHPPFGVVRGQGGGGTRVGIASKCQGQGRGLEVAVEGCGAQGYLLGLPGAARPCEPLASPSGLIKRSQVDPDTRAAWMGQREARDAPGGLT